VARGGTVFLCQLPHQHKPQRFPVKRYGPDGRKVAMSAVTARQFFIGTKIILLTSAICELHVSKFQALNKRF